MKRIISLLIVVSVICSSVIFTASAEEFDYSIYEKEVKVLTELGITTDNVPGASNENMVTRAELAALAIKALGYDNVSLNSHTNVFTDVSQSHWAYNYIMFAHSINLFSGTSATTFEPDSPVDSSQAITIMIKMLNYNEHAKLKGGYPSGYWITAGNIGILDGADIDKNGTITREQLYILMYNTIHADMLVPDGVSNDNANYVKDGSTILSNNLHIQYIDGVITADGEASISGDITSSEIRFNIGDMQFEAKDNSVLGKVGRKVRVYYKDEKKAVSDAVCVWEEENNEVILSSESIISFDYASGVYKAIDGDREKSYKIGKNYYLSYNGEAVFGSDPALMLPSSGHITLIDNDIDGVYDVVSVKEYYNIVFGGYDAYSNTIIDKLDSSKNIDLDDFINIASNVKDYSSIQQKNILTIYKGRTGTSIKIQVSEINISGEISQINTEDGFTAGGNAYKMSLAPRLNSDGLKVGSDCTLYLDAYNGIAYYEIIPASQGGYILEFSSGSGLENAKVQMLTLDGSLKAFDLANKVTIETSAGTGSVSGSAVSSYFNNLSGSKRLYVLYNQNSEKEINRITLPKIIKTQDEYDNIGGYPLYKMDYYIYNWPNPTTSGYVQYKSKNMGYGNWLILGENTVVLNVVNETQTNYSVDDFMCGSVKTSLRPDETIIVKKNNEGNKSTREIDVYKIGDSGYVPDVLIKYDVQTSKNVSDDNDFIVIKELSQAINPETEEVSWKLTYMQGSNEMTGFLSSDFSNDRAQILSSPYASSISTPTISPNKLMYEFGDIAKISKNLKGEIINLCLIYDAKNKTLSFPTLSAFNRIFRIIDGRVKFIDNGYIEIETTSDASIERSRIDGCKITVIDTLNDEVRTGTFADISADDQIVIYSRYGDNKTVAVYKTRR